MEDWCVYITYHPLYGYYYVGKSSVFAVTQQYYKGSGYGIDDELNSERGPEYLTEIIATYETEQEAYDAEKMLVGTRYKTDRLCLNRRPGGGVALTSEEKYKRAGKPTREQVKAEIRRQKLREHEAQFGKYLRRK